ncbi:thioredoxin family protein [Lysinibacillus sp. NPDC097231]|uniref:thioredoxin family protein n=1 Tax=Lysinibacillus sp. NPDC097231 TaxID=3364142 RepID=UPI00382A33AF
MALDTVTNKVKSDKLSSMENLYGKSDLQPETIDLIGDKNYQNIILPDALKSKINSGEQTVAYFFSPTCVHCKAFTPDMMQIANERNLEIHQLNLLESQDSMKDYEILSTPTLVYFNGGEEVDRLVGKAPAEDVHQFFNQVKWP